MGLKGRTGHTLIRPKLKASFNTHYNHLCTHFQQTNRLIKHRWCSGALWHSGTAPSFSSEMYEFESHHKWTCVVMVSILCLLHGGGGSLPSMSILFAQIYSHTHHHTPPQPHTSNSHPHNSQSSRHRFLCDDELHHRSVLSATCEAADDVKPIHSLDGSPIL
jgi:hypothetical protein